MANRGRQRITAAAFALLSLIATTAGAQTLYSIGTPTNDEQYMLELVNRARVNGDAEAARLGLSSLNEGPPTEGSDPWTILSATQPLSWNPKLQNAAQGQADVLQNGDQFFSGQSPHTYPNGTSSPQARIAAAGYQEASFSTARTSQNGFLPGPEAIAEEISQGSGPYTGARVTTAVRTAHEGVAGDPNNAGLFRDLTVPGRGHRSTIMYEFWREIGIGISTGTDQGQGSTWDSIYIVQDFGAQSSSSTSGPYITGVVYQDANGNGFYDPGEGVGGVSVHVAGANYYAVTSSSGGYSVPVSGDGNYTVSFSGGGVTSTNKSATISGNLNAKVDFVTTPTAEPTVLANISTRMLVQLDPNELIGGFIVTGSAPKKIMVRAIGPSLNIAGELANPTLELRDGSGNLLEANDDWQQSPEKQAIIDSTIPPSNPLESAIVRTVPANGAKYTAIVRGVNRGTGVGLVEVYDLDRTAASKLANISTRGNVQTGNNVMIGGFIVTGSAAQKVVVRAIGPSLSQQGVSGALANPFLELHDGNGTVVASNDNWKTGSNGQSQQAAIEATGVPPTNDLESALVTTLPANGSKYTAIVRGATNGTGVALVEVYALN
jgi:uncharacterized protein YkwD